MGYRHYFYKIKKDKVDISEIKYIYDKNGYISYYDLKEDELGLEEIYEFGKHYENSESFYKIEINKEINELFKNEDTEFIFVSALPAFENAIKYYHKKILDYYNSLNVLDEWDSMCNITIESKHKNFIDSKIRTWEAEYFNPYNINLNQDKIVDAWDYEYEIFELVRLYKTFDYENYYLIFCGH